MVAIVEYGDGAPRSLTKRCWPKLDDETNPTEYHAALTAALVSPVQDVPTLTNVVVEAERKTNDAPAKADKRHSEEF